MLASLLDRGGVGKTAFYAAPAANRSGTRERFAGTAKASRLPLRRKRSRRYLLRVAGDVTVAARPMRRAGQEGPTALRALAATEALLAPVAAEDGLGLLGGFAAQ